MAVVDTVVAIQEAKVMVMAAEELQEPEAIPDQEDLRTHLQENISLSRMVSVNRARR